MGIASHEKRISPRKIAHGRGELVDAVSGAISPFDLLDVSAGGLSFLSDASRPKDSMWIVRFELKGKRVRGLVRIAYCVKHSLTDAYRFGAEFKDWEPVHLKAVQSYLD